MQLESLNALENFARELQRIGAKTLFPFLECIRLYDIIFNEHDVDVLIGGKGPIIGLKHMYGSGGSVHLELRHCVMGSVARRWLGECASPWVVDYDEHTAPPLDPESKPRLPPGIASALRKIGSGRKIREAQPAMQSRTRD